MLNDKDRRHLERWAGRDGAIAQAVVAVVAIGLLATAALNLALAASWGRLIGLGVPQLLSGWVHGVQWDHQYGGIYLKAMDRLEATVLDCGLSVVLVVAAAGGRAERVRTRNIIA